MPTHRDLPTEWLEGPPRDDKGHVAAPVSNRRPTVTAAEVGVVGFITAVLGFILGQSV